jgi:hypothetical protein
MAAQIESSHQAKTLATPMMIAGPNTPKSNTHVGLSLRTVRGR